MKRHNLGLLLYVITTIILIVNCGGGGIRTSPEGSYVEGSTSFELTSSGTITIEHQSSAQDPRDYVVTGTYTYTHVMTDEENEQSYGHLDVTISSITLDGMTADSLEITDQFTGQDIWPGALLLGWWRWMGLINQMNLRLNVPATGYRDEDPWSGTDWLIIGLEE